MMMQALGAAASPKLMHKAPSVQVIHKAPSVQALIEQDQGSSRRERRGSQYMSHEPQARLNLAAPGQHIPMPKSLGEVLQNPVQRHKFRKFLKERKADESLLFYESVELYSKIEDPKWAKVAAADIVSKFIDEQGAYEVNISGPIREQLLNNKKWERTSFDEAKAETYKLLKSNFFAAFVAREYLNSD